MAFNAIKGLESLLPKKPERPAPEIEKLQLQERFEQGVKGKFDILENARFASRIEGVDSLLTVVPKARPGKEAPDSLNVVVSYSMPRGEKGTATLTLGGDGSFYGDLGKELKRRGVTALDIYSELMDQLEPLRLRKWHVIPDLGLKGVPYESVFGGGEGDSNWEPSAFDPSRKENIDAVMRQPDVLFSLKGENSINESDHVVVFPDFLMIENMRTEHAAYFMDIPGIEVKSIPAKEEDFRKWVQSQEWFGLLKGKRSDLLKRGAMRKFHSGEWRKRISDEIEERRNKRSAQQ